MTIGCVDSWVNTELKSLKLGDTRLNKRFLDIMNQISIRFGDNISSTFRSWKEIKAAYRFFSNKRVKEADILAPHIKESIERIRLHKTVLLAQDTTYFNFPNRKKTTGLDKTARSKLSKETEGLMLHNTLAITDSGVPLGLIDQHFIERKELYGNNRKENRKIRHWNSSVDEKESIRWINTLKKAHAINFGDTRIIHIADRESDFYEFFREGLDLGANVLIRAARNRSINKTNRREAPSEYLFDYLKQKEAQGKIAIKLQVNGTEKYRTANVDIVFTTISMPPPPNKTKKKDGNLPILPLSAIMAIERKPPKDRDGICWVLLTNMTVDTLETAIQKIHWYSLRWNIELFHKVLKSGCGVEKAQLRTASRLKKYIILKSIVAWRLFWLSRQYKKCANKSCLTVLSHEEWTILYRKTFKTNQLPNMPPTVGEVFVWIAKLGGYIDRSSDPPPGMISLWKGWQRLMDILVDFRDICG